MKTLLFLCIAVVCAGCYTTRVDYGYPAVNEVHEDTQWFLIAGLVPLSDPEGEVCGSGVAWAESEFGVTDALLSLGLEVAGLGLGVLTCDGISSPSGYSACISAWGTLPAFVGSRTVRYACAPPDGVQGSKAASTPSAD